MAPWPQYSTSSMVTTQHLFYGHHTAPVLWSQHSTSSMVPTQHLFYGPNTVPLLWSQHSISSIVPTQHPCSCGTQHLCLCGTQHIVVFAHQKPFRGVLPQQIFFEGCKVDTAIIWDWEKMDGKKI